MFENVLSIDREGASELAINVEKETFDAYPQLWSNLGTITCPLVLCSREP